MDTTERLHDQIHDAEIEMKRIDVDAAALQDAIDELVRAFSAKYPKVAMSALSEDFASRLSDIVDDLQGPAYRRKSRLEDDICNADWADLERNSPVVL